MDYYQRLEEAVQHIQSQAPTTPAIGVILGSGLGNFTTGIDVHLRIPYEDIPHFPVSTVEGHSGALVYGSVEGAPILAMAGRFHFYEGYTAEEVIFPIRVMQRLGVQTLLLSNAAGGVNPAFRVGELMIIHDHISFAIHNPLQGKNDERFGPRFPDMSEPYRKDLIRLAKEIAAEADIAVSEGVYFGVTGPTFETRAEYRMIHALGGDAVGMSTVQEVIAAVHLGMDVFGMSVITDLGIREEENTITHAEVLEAATAAEPLLTSLFRGMIRRLHAAPLPARVR